MTREEILKEREAIRKGILCEKELGKTKYIATSICNDNSSFLCFCGFIVIKNATLSTTTFIDPYYKFLCTIIDWKDREIDWDMFENYN